MDSVQARTAFEAELAREDGLDLTRAALTIGLIERADLDIALVATRLDRLAREVGKELPRGLPPDRAAQELGAALGERRGFRGDVDDYDDPRNCFLHTTLARRRGMPITLSLIYITVGRRCGYSMAGIGLPWHFVARIGDEASGYAYLDPFDGGQSSSPEGLAQLLRQRGVEPGERLDLYLAAITPRQLLMRMLLNIKRVYLERHDDGRARAAADLLLVISPWSTEELRDRGLLSARLGERNAARADLLLYLEREPQAADAARIRAVLRALDVA
jgi:regulator of sirC expression with transglutaminase-like and TPR domain